MQDRKYTIKTMTREELNIAIEWAAAEGWNPGIYDADCYYRADPDAFLIGRLGDEPIATISAVKYEQSFGFIGFYIVKPEYRGKGYGIQIWNAGIRYLGHCNMGLDGVVALQDNYKKYGFKLAYRNIRYEGVGGGVPPENADVVKLTTLPFEVVETYDRAFFPDNRTQFLKCWLNQSESHALGIMQNGKLAGYGVIRLCRSGYKIAPLFADNLELAESLFLALKACAKSSVPIYIDVPEVNQAGITLAKRYNLKLVFETARMYNKENPDLPLNRLFGVTSFELG